MGVPIEIQKFLAAHTDTRERIQRRRFYACLRTGFFRFIRHLR